MNKLLTLSLLAGLLFSTQIYGQKKPEWDKIKALKVAFITEQLALTPGEAEAFWPIYNKYDDERNALRGREHTEIRDKMRQMENFSEKEAGALLNAYLVIEEEEEELDRAFLKNLSKVITAKKTLILLRAEEEFKKQLIRQYRSRGGSTN
jgi:sugar-specific transcriptional regulator TrmB